MIEQVSTLVNERTICDLETELKYKSNRAVQSMITTVTQIISEEMNKQPALMDVEDLSMLTHLWFAEFLRARIINESEICGPVKCCGLYKFIVDHSHDMTGRTTQ